MAIDKWRYYEIHGDTTEIHGDKHMAIYTWRYIYGDTTEIHGDTTEIHGDRYMAIYTWRYYGDTWRYYGDTWR